MPACGAGRSFGTGAEFCPQIKGIRKCQNRQSAILDAAKGIFDREPSEVQELREQSVAETDEAGYQEYYFNLLDEGERRIYREMLEGIQNRAGQFLSDDF